jgi:superoxide dismutase, Cu-Zn family
MQKLRFLLFLTIALATAGAGVAMAGGGDGDRGDHRGKGKRATATLVDGTGAKVGKVTLYQWRGKVTVAGRVKGLTPGFHGFHIHTIGQCVPPFTSAGGHFNPGATTHNAHAGDLPSLLVNGDGTASAAFETDRFTLRQLRDADGSALMIHSDPDNFANIPADRYKAPDQITLDTGDAGSRVACGVIR